MKKTETGAKRQLAKLMLNSLYGKFGQTDIENKTAIVHIDEVDKIIKKYQYENLIHLKDNLVLIVYSSRINPRILNLLKNNDEGNEVYDIFKRLRGTPSSVAISAAVSAYARMDLNRYRLIPDNPLVYTAVDSAHFEKPLPSELVGKELGCMKLEATIKKGIYLTTGLYAYQTIDGKEKIVSAGVKKGKLTFQDFEKAYKGKDVVINQVKFERSWENLSISPLGVNREHTIRGLNQPIIPNAYEETGEKLNQAVVPTLLPVVAANPPILQIAAPSPDPLVLEKKDSVLIDPVTVICLPAPSPSLDLVPYSPPSTSLIVRSSNYR